MIRALVGYILDWILGKIIEIYRQMKAQKQADKAIDDKVKKQADDVKQSKTDKEDEDAAREILSRSK